MVGTGQGTPLHDHAGIWADAIAAHRGDVALVRGGDPETGVVQLEKETSIVAGRVRPAR
jgi:hypothetical protein